MTPEDARKAAGFLQSVDMEIKELCLAGFICESFEPDTMLRGHRPFGVGVVFSIEGDDKICRIYFQRHSAPPMKGYWVVSRRQYRKRGVDEPPDFKTRAFSKAWEELRWWMRHDPG